MAYPNELHYRFLREANQNPNYINKRLNYTYTQNVMENHCLITIKPSELKKYVISNQPNIVCEFVVTPDSEYNYSFYHGILKSPHPYQYEDGYSYDNSQFIEYVKTEDENDAIGHGVYDELPFGWTYDYRTPNQEYNLPPTSFHIGYDLVTTYYILKNRLSCKENVAKKAVIDTLDYIVEHTSKEPLMLVLCRVQGLLVHYIELSRLGCSYII